MGNKHNKTTKPVLLDFNKCIRDKKDDINTTYDDRQIIESRDEKLVFGYIQQVIIKRNNSNAPTDITHLIMLFYIQNTFRWTINLHECHQQTYQCSYHVSLCDNTDIATKVYLTFSIGELFNVLRISSKRLKSNKYPYLSNGSKLYVHIMCKKLNYDHQYIKTYRSLPISCFFTSIPDKSITFDFYFAMLPSYEWRNCVDELRTSPSSLKYTWNIDENMRKRFITTNEEIKSPKIYNDVCFCLSVCHVESYGDRKYLFRIKLHILSNPMGYDSDLIHGKLILTDINERTHQCFLCNQSRPVQLIWTCIKQIEFYFTSSDPM